MGFLSALLFSAVSAPPVTYIVSAALFVVDGITYFSKE